MKKIFILLMKELSLLVGVLAIISYSSLGAVAQQKEANECKLEKITENQKSLLHGIVYKWYLPESMNESELIKDFKALKEIAAQHGALSSKLFRTEKKGEYIGMQYWPTLEIYDQWFDQKNFRFREQQSKETMDLIKKIKDVYKNQFLDEIKEIV